MHAHTEKTTFSYKDDLCEALHIQGVPKKIRLHFCLYLGNQVMDFQIVFFLLKTETHTKNLNTKPILCDFLGLRYLQNKMGFWSKLKLFDIELSHILKTFMIKTVITSISQFGLLGPLGVTWELSGPVFGQFAELGANFAVSRPLWESMNMKWSISKSDFVSWIFRLPDIAQKCLSIQHERMDLSFQKKKTV